MSFVLSTVILSLLCIVLLPLIKSYARTRRLSKYIDVLPGEKSYPVIGTMWKTMLVSREDYFEYFKGRFTQYGPIFRCWYGSTPLVYICKPEYAQVIFKSSTQLKKGHFYQFLKPWLGDGLISTSNIPRWRAHRKIITPTFHFKILDAYGDIFTEKSQIFVDYLAQFDGKGYFEVTGPLNRISLDIICESAMGVKLGFLTKVEGEEYEYAKAIFEFLGIVLKRVGNPILANDFLFGLTKLGRDSRRHVQTVNNMNSKVIKSRRAYLKENKTHSAQGEDDDGVKQKQSFLDMLLTLQEQDGLGDDEIAEEVNTFMLGGQETTAATVTFSLMALGNNPDILERVHKELDVIFADDPNRKVTSQDLAALEYFDRVFKEVLRCYCFVPTVSRELHEDLEIGGVILPKETCVNIGLESLHHDPDHYPDPYKFDPDRFLPEITAKRHPYAFVPFSAGPRNCIGQKFAVRNSKTLLVYILRHYTVKCLEKPEELKYFFEAVLKPQKGLHIAIESRRR